MVAFACVLVFAAVPMCVAGLVLLPEVPAVGVGFALGSLVGGAAYCALFALLSVMTRHAVVIGLIYVLIWEGLLGGLLDGIRWLSVTRWSTEIVDGSPASSSSTTCRRRTPWSRLLAVDAPALADRLAAAGLQPHRRRVADHEKSAQGDEPVTRAGA